MAVVRWFVQQLEADDVRNIGILLGEKVEGKRSRFEVRFALPEFHFASVDAAMSFRKISMRRNASHYLQPSTYHPCSGRLGEWSINTVCLLSGLKSAHRQRSEDQAELRCHSVQQYLRPFES